MDVSPNELQGLIDSVGFPIVAAGALFWLNINHLKNQREIISEMIQTLKEVENLIQKIHEVQKLEQDKLREEIEHYVDKVKNSKD